MAISLWGISVCQSVCLLLIVTNTDGNFLCIFAEFFPELTFKRTSTHHFYSTNVQLDDGKRVSLGYSGLINQYVLDLHAPIAFNGFDNGNNSCSGISVHCEGGGKSNQGEVPGRT